MRCRRSRARCCWCRTTARCSTPSGSRTIAFEDGRLHNYQGGWAEYARVREERREAEAAPSAERRSRSRRRQRPRGARSGPSKNAVRRVAELEREVERAEAALAALEDELADPAMWSSPTRRERATKRHADAKRAVEQAYAAWERAPGGARAARPRAGRGGAAGAGRPRRGRMAPQSSREGSPARDAVGEALVGQRLAGCRLDRVHAAQLAAEVLLRRLDQAVAVVVEVGVDRPTGWST